MAVRLKASGTRWEPAGYALAVLVRHYNPLAAKRWCSWIVLLPVSSDTCPGVADTAAAVAGTADTAVPDSAVEDATVAAVAVHASAVRKTGMWNYQRCLSAKETRCRTLPAQT